MNPRQLYQAVYHDVQIGPEKVMISPTDFCNLRCGICWRLAKDETYDELSITEIKSLLAECKKLGTQVIDFTGGGEPFFRPDIFEVIRLIKAYGFFGTLTTNGTLLNEEAMRELIRLRLDDVCFSLDGHTAQINDLIRGEGVYRQVVRAISRLTELKKKYASSLPVVRMATVITRLNYKGLDGLVRLAARLKIRAINFSVLIEWQTNERYWMRDESRAHIEQQLRRAHTEAMRQGIATNLPAVLRWGLFEHPKPAFCFAPWTLSFVNASGDVMVCCTLASLYKNLIGNVKRQSFSAIWFGSRMRQFRTDVKKGKLPAECVRCIPEFTDMYNEMYGQIRRLRSSP